MFNLAKPAEIYGHQIRRPLVSDEDDDTSPLPSLDAAEGEVPHSPLLEPMARSCAVKAGQVSECNSHFIINDGKRHGSV